MQCNTTVSLKRSDNRDARQCSTRFPDFSDTSNAKKTRLFLSRNKIQNVLPEKPQKWELGLYHSLAANVRAKNMENPSVVLRQFLETYCAKRKKNGEFSVSFLFEIETALTTGRYALRFRRAFLARTQNKRLT